MATALETKVTELPESRVRVEAQVAHDEVERRVEQAARALGRDMRIPGFRKGKVPAALVIQRVGREVVLDEAVRGALGGWYVEALDRSGIAPVGDPEINLDSLPEGDKPLSFSFEIGVRPVAELGGKAAVKVERREAQADEEAVEAEIEALRERFAKLETVDRGARSGDFVVIDFVGKLDGEPFPGGAGQGQLLELGSERFIPGFEEQLVGATAGDERVVRVTFPEEYGAEHLAGKDAEFDVTVGEVKEKALPELDDDFASDAAGFETLEELREDVRGRLREADEQRVEAEYREAVLDAVAADAKVEIPDALVEAHARDLWDQMIHSLSHRGISREAYLQISGRSEEEILAEARPDAEKSLRRDAVLAAVVAADGIEVSDDELLEELRASAEGGRTKPEKLLKQLRDAGRLEGLRRDVAHRKALDLLVERAGPKP